LLRKRAVIESAPSFLKNIRQIEHSRRRSDFIIELTLFIPRKLKKHAH
jgi:hypothetical protein